MNVKYLMSKNPIRVCPYSQCTKLQNWLLIHSKMTLHRILSVNNLEMYPLWIYKSPHSRYRYLLSLYCKLTRVERKEERNIPFSFNLIPWSILPSVHPSLLTMLRVTMFVRLHRSTAILWVLPSIRQPVYL